MSKVKDLAGSDLTVKLTANQLLEKFLKENHIILVPDRHEAGTYFVNDGFVLNDKPQLKLKAVYEHEER